MRHLLYAPAWLLLGASSGLLWAKQNLDRTYDLARHVPAIDQEIEQLYRAQSWLGIATFLVLLVTIAADRYLLGKEENEPEDFGG